jgi:hypothetical protein
MSEMLESRQIRYTDQSQLRTSATGPFPVTLGKRHWLTVITDEYHVLTILLDVWQFKQDCVVLLRRRLR